MDLSSEYAVWLLWGAVLLSTLIVTWVALGFVVWEAVENLLSEG